VTAPAVPNRAAAGLLALSLLAVVAICVLDAFTPPGIVVGVLLVVPLATTASMERPRDVVWVFAASSLGYGIAAVVGVRAAVPPGAWLHNRILVVCVLVCTAYLALQLQRRRGQAPKPSGEVEAQELNRLLMSLIVHDLRSPLTTAMHTLDYLEQRIPDSSEDAMISEARARLRRNLRLVDAFLAVTHSARDGAAQVQRVRQLSSAQLAEVLHEEVSGFRAEAAGRNKQLLLYHATAEVPDFTVDLLVLRHALTILLDNAVRYALPGAIRVTTRLDAAELAIAVEDSGPGTSGGAQAHSGAGLGLQLCAALLRRAGGELSRVRDEADGSCFELRLPVEYSRPGTGVRPAEPAGFRRAAAAVP
jgi:K+-sensing histidine kinase KdpD